MSYFIMSGIVPQGKRICFMPLHYYIYMLEKSHNLLTFVASLSSIMPGS